MAHWHDHNPWADRLVYVSDLRQLAECVANKPEDIPEIISRWESYGPKLDGYILPQPSPELYSIGIRYGTDGADYLSPWCRWPYRAEALVKLYRPEP